MYCQVCGRHAPTRKVTFLQNVGALVMRFSKTISGNLCKPCIHKYFWQFTLIDLTLGWWGIISLIVTPFFILINLYHYLTSLGMSGPDVVERAPELTPEIAERIGPFTDEIFQRISAGEDSEKIANSVAARAACDPGQVFRYTGIVLNQLRQHRE